jgi:hypothetical protein
MKTNRIYNKWYKELWFSIQEWWADDEKITTINMERDSTDLALGLGFWTALAIFVFWLIVRTR